MILLIHVYHNSSFSFYFLSVCIHDCTLVNDSVTGQNKPIHRLKLMCHHWGNRYSDDLATYLDCILSSVHGQSMVYLYDKTSCIIQSWVRPSHSQGRIFRFGKGVSAAAGRVWEGCLSALPQWGVRGASRKIFDVHTQNTAIRAYLMVMRCMIYW